MKTTILYFAIITILFTSLGFVRLSFDDQLQTVIQEHGLAEYTPLPEFDSTKVELGRLLFFDKLLSGNKDISCATCHHPTLASADALPLSIGVGGQGLGQKRIMGADRDRVPRNAPDIFNRGGDEWHTMFWDNRVSGSVTEGFITPANEKLPKGLENIMAAQAMFPVTSRDEMRGDIGDLDVFGQENELALISNASPNAIWHRIMLRILSFPEYRQLFKTVYPDVKEKDLGFQHAANAIAAFEIVEFTFHDSPWDRYLSGDYHAITDEVKRGALLFYGKANCASCHSGQLMTDQQTYNIGVPQLGPGKASAEPLDAGRYTLTGQKEHRFAFRTPSLKNTAVTGPWMHNGAYINLEDVVMHHLYPEEYLKNYKPSQLPEELRGTLKNDESLIERILATLDPKVKPLQTLNRKDVKALVSFLEALTDDSTRDLDRLIPEEVPSGLPVAD